MHCSHTTRRTLGASSASARSAQQAGSQESGVQR